MLEARTQLHLLVRPQPGAVNLPLLVLRSPRFSRPFHPHLGLIWTGMVRPAAGGPALISLVEKGARPAKGKRTGDR